MILIDSWPYDLMVEGELKFSSDITMHPMEEGADTTDHISNKPMEFTTTVIVSDTPIGEIEQDDSRRVDEVSLAVFGSDQQPLPSAEAYERLQAIRNAKKGVTIEIPVAARGGKPGKRLFVNMGLEELTEPMNKDTSGGMTFSATWKQMRFLKNARTTIRTATPRGGGKTKRTVTTYKFHVDKRILWRMGAPPGSPLVVNYPWAVINVDTGNHPRDVSQDGSVGTLGMTNLQRRDPTEAPRFIFSGQGDARAATEKGLEAGAPLTGDQLRDMFKDIDRDNAAAAVQYHQDTVSGVHTTFGDHSKPSYTIGKGTSPNNTDMSRFTLPGSDTPAGQFDNADFDNKVGGNADKTSGFYDGLKKRGSDFFISQ